MQIYKAAKYNTDYLIRMISQTKVTVLETKES